MLSRVLGELLLLLFCLGLSDRAGLLPIKGNKFAWFSVAPKQSPGCTAPGSMALSRRDGCNFAQLRLESGYIHHGEAPLIDVKTFPGELLVWVVVCLGRKSSSGISGIV